MEPNPSRRMGGAPIGRMVGVEFCASEVIGDSSLSRDEVDGARHAAIGRALRLIQGLVYALHKIPIWRGRRRLLGWWYGRRLSLWQAVLGQLVLRQFQLAPHHSPRRSWVEVP